MLSSKSRIFEHVHTVASFCNQVPAQVKYDSNLNTVHVITATGNQYNVFSLAKLAKLYVSDLLPSKITHLAAQDYSIACVCHDKVFVCVRGKVCSSYSGHSCQILGALFIGDYLLSWDNSSELHVYHKVTCVPVVTLSLRQPNFSISKVLHPTTYLNKVLIGSVSGRLQLWNIKTGKMVYEFQKVMCDSIVCSLCQSPVVDVVGIGCQSGTIIVANIKSDTVIQRFNQNSSEVTALAFRLDDAPVLVCCTMDGCIGFWNLNERTLQSITREASDSSHPITGLQCVKSQNLMVTSSSSNCLRIWTFDSKDGTAPRVLIERFGHAEGAISKLRFYDSEMLLSTGADGSVKKLSLQHERHSRNLGRSRTTTGKNTKLSSDFAEDILLGAATDMACQVRRQADWDSAVSCHLDSEVVCSWNVYKGTIGVHRLRPEPRQRENVSFLAATCVDLTCCGNFSVVGYNNGCVNKYNIQSGDLRGSVGSEERVSCCVGVAVDNLNTKLVVARSAGLSFYNFNNLKAIGSTLNLSEDIGAIRMHRESCLLAAALTDFSIEVVDYVEQCSVRRFNDTAVSCHTARILDMVFTTDSRWLVTSSLDSTIRVWNIPTGSLIDCFTTENPAVTVDLSQTSDVLCAAFLNSIGVAVLSNISLYRPVDLSPLPVDFKPNQSLESMSIELSDNFKYESPDIVDALCSLSLQGEGSSKWLNLIRHDIIKERNKPRQPPKAVKSAPFFIPTVAGLEFKFDTAETKRLLSRNPHDKQKKMFLDDISVLVKMLDKRRTVNEILSFLETKSPAAIDFEIYSLSEEQGGSIEFVQLFFRCLLESLRAGSSVDSCHAMIQVALKHHGPSILDNSLLFEKILSQLKTAHETKWKQVAKKFQITVAVASFLRSPLI